MEEEPVRFSSNGESLLGILTHPATDPLGICLVALGGGGVSAGIGRNRILLDVCRASSAMGFHALRFDYHGIGDSTGYVKEFRTEAPFTGDLLSAVELARERGVDRFVMVGTCFGARTALTAACRMDRVDGLVLLSPPLRDMVRGARGSTPTLLLDMTWSHIARRAISPSAWRMLVNSDTRPTYFRLVAAKFRSHAFRLRARRQADKGFSTNPWLSRGLVRSLEALAGREVPTLLLYGSEDSSWRDFEASSAGSLGPVLARFGPALTLQRLPGELHGFPTVDIQSRALDSITSWLNALTQTKPAPLLKLPDSAERT